MAGYTWGFGIPLLLAIYLVFKGQELRMLAALRPLDEREQAERRAAIWFYAAVAIAVLFAISTAIELIEMSNG